jgi:protein-disulfide isomerase
MESKNKKNDTGGGLPLVIIGVVLLVAVIGGWWLYQFSSRKTPAVNSNARANAATQQTTNTTLQSSVQGAQPPHYKGAQYSPVVVEEFADYQCPTCAMKHPVMNEIVSIYGSRIKFIFRNYPLIQIHKNAYDAAVAAESAGLQGKFWEMQNILFQNQRNWSNVADPRPVFEGYAQTLGLDVERFKADMSGINAKQRVDADMARARSLNLTGTPSVIINGRPIEFEQMTVEGMRQIIDAELAKTSSQQTPPAAPPAKQTDEDLGIEKAPSANSAANAKK